MKKEQAKQSIIALLQANDDLLVSEITTKLNRRYYGGHAHYTNEEVLNLLKEIQIENGVKGGSLELSTDATTKQAAPLTLFSYPFRMTFSIN